MDIVVHMVVWDATKSDGSEDDAQNREVMEYFAHQVPFPGKAFKVGDNVYWVEGFRVMAGEQPLGIEVGNPPKWIHELFKAPNKRGG